ncbi:hypothetical protein CB0940_05400 [Cercospora beticola]|uniref:Uncharacterized protein n=1 Tax=Cercospora beticola TaxID=122368 RepID=A0A2G5I1H2_CERBT|nr:hypothetical protein CB0940_05400 [Cercospora beticola]PIA98373.1 hypothetical protein CB0940_05400 [Cercospora beticola]WPA97942.1 hypothetical protein RHO25_002553 [Cercospora beticola]
MPSLLLPAPPPPHCATARTRKTTTQVDLTTAMADIQQWRRKIQPARSRTPATPFPDHEEPDDYFTSTTPKKRIKPKLSSYFGHNQKSSLQGDVATSTELPAWPPDQFYPDPKPEEVLDEMMCTLMASLYKPLDPRHNSSLMLVFEAYRDLIDEKARLQQRLGAEVASNKALVAKLNMAEKDWEDEKQDYKDEVKRLEVLLAKASKRGVAEVTLARQESRLHGHQSRGLHKKETIFELLEKSNLYDDKTWDSQRATMKPIVQSPSNKDIQASQQLAQKKSMTHLHAELPFGTPPTSDIRFSLTNPSLEQDLRKLTSRKRADTGSTTQSDSEDTFSTFSCEELVSPDQPALQFLSQDEDYVSIAKIAESLARRRRMDPAQIMPQLLTMFNAQVLDSGKAVSMPTALPHANNPWPARTTSMLAATNAAPSRHRTVMSKASGFLQKLVPQLNMDPSTGPEAIRRFSFEPGDDSIPAGNQPQASCSDHKDRVLRKTVSAYALRGPDMATAPRSLSPVAQSPTASTLGDVRVGPFSRIPTPVFSSGSLARPRQEREDSAASLLTVIQQNDEKCRARSVSSSPSGSRINLARAAHEVLTIQSPVPRPISNESDILRGHSNSLRGPGLTAGTARGTHIRPDISPRGQSIKRQSTQHLRSSYTASSVSIDVRQENTRPAN